MRHVAITLASASLLSLAACGGGGGGVEALGSVTPPKVDIGTLTPSPTPAASANLLDVTASTDYTVVGGLQTLAVNATNGTLYRGNASITTNTASKVNYSPRDGVFTLTLADQAAGLNRTVRFQDPAHRTVDTLEREIPQLTGFNYVAALDGAAESTFFYQRPGATGIQYVSLAGFAHTEVNATSGEQSIERGAFVFGTKTATMQVPISGTGTYSGGFVASMLGTKFNEGGRTSVPQWLVGNSTVSVDFAAATVGLSLNGRVLDAALKNTAVDNAAFNIPGGSTFTATGTARIDYLRGSGFTGAFTAASFNVAGRGDTPVDFRSVNAGSSVAGASSIDGTFYGPNAVNVGGSFRITGGTPDQRVDILGGFNGGK